jgi:hypothetical protein
VSLFEGSAGVFEDPMSEGDQTPLSEWTPERGLDAIRQNFPSLYRDLREAAELGCDPRFLVFCLRGPTQALESVSGSKTAFTTNAEALRRAADILLTAEQLAQTRAIMALSEGVEGVPRPSEIAEWNSWWADHFDSWAATSSKRTNLLIDDAKAAVVRHFQERTLREHDELVSRLIEGASQSGWANEDNDREPYSTDAHKKWRSRHDGLVKRRTLHERVWAANYGKGG